MVNSAARSRLPCCCASAIAWCERDSRLLQPARIGEGERLLIRHPVHGIRVSLGSFYHLLHARTIIPQKRNVVLQKQQFRSLDFARRSPVQGVFSIGDVPRYNELAPRW